MNLTNYMNNLKNVTQLKNTYYILRHGESKANVQGIILSNPEDGTINFGLTNKGRKQVRTSALKNTDLNEDTVIYSSDFTRARETADIARKIFGSSKLYLVKNLRERFFGDFDKTNNDNYEKVWRNDIKDSSHTISNVESVDSVLERTTSLIVALEKKYENQKILLVAHGDPLQILQTAFSKINPLKHRELKQLEIAEIRKLNLS
ncbi:MAG: histidine phosphatase family protein [Candidatus Moranbacteria bacterium]|nr:histidine phosphatase family protein [Candidatus Moranbacteria bacterium]